MSKEHAMQTYYLKFEDKDGEWEYCQSKSGSPEAAHRSTQLSTKSKKVEFVMKEEYFENRGGNKKED